MQISVIIVTYNRKEALRRCLSSIVSQTNADVEVLVCDNGSADDSAEMVAHDFAQVILIRSQENLGVGRGRNLAAKQARGAWLVFLDDDEYVIQPNFMADIRSTIAANLPYDAINFTLLTPSGELFTNYIPRFDKMPQPADSECACLMSGACAIRADIFRALGGFWELLTPYGYEDRDFMFRFLEAGHRALWSRRLEVIHDKEEDPNLNARWLRFMPAHHGFVALRHLPWRYVASYALHGWGYFAWKALRRGLLWPYLQSLGRFMWHVPQVLRMRKPLSPEVIAYCKQHSGRLRY